MAMFGDLDLFSEFDKDREAQGSFIHYDEENSKSRIIFEDYEDESENESEDDFQSAVTKPETESGTKTVDIDVTKNENKDNKSRNTSDKTVEKIKVTDGVNKGDGDARSVTHSRSVEDEKKVAWLNSQLYAEAAEEASKKNTSSHQLIFERNKFQRFAKILDSTRYTPDDDSPAVQLLFNNNSFARKYRQQIEQFIKGLLWEEFRNPKETLSEVTVKPGHPSCVDINKNLSTELRSEHMRQKHALIGNSQFHKQFLIDFLGWPFNVAEPARCNVNWEIPLYAQVFNEVYSQITAKSSEKAKPSKPKPACWNCGETNHAVIDCKLPRNPARIAASRKEFLAQQSKPSTPKFSGPSRYHMDPELASKYAKFKPGELSDALRLALGLRSDQLPQHIYKMRLYGYPPGWLAEAKQVTSGVSIFDKHGRVALITGECLEDGELDDGEAKQTTQPEFDLNKIVEYPGFTVPVPIGINDEHDTFKMPPIQQHQLKKTLMSQDKSSNKKRKRTKTEDNKEDVKKMKKESSNGDAETDKPEDSDTQKLAEDETQTPAVSTPLSEPSSSTKSMSMDFGTPIFTREKTSLPDAQLFGKDIEEHIPFENLPSATGTFDKMKHVFDKIKKIRNQS